MRGKIRIIEHGENYGFITGEDGKDYYFNKASLVESLNFRDLTKGVEVEFSTQKQSKGLSAINCRIVENESIEFFKKHVLEMSDHKEIYDLFCDHSNSYAERLRDGKVTTSMIRKIYARILNAQNVTEIKLLRPQFAYTAGRNEKNNELREFMNLLDYLVKSMELNNEKHLNNFKQFLEAIVAYRKYVGEDS